MTVAEPPRPQRGMTAEERGRDVSVAQQEVEERRSWAQKALAAASPTFLLSQAEGYPTGVKQFLQFCLILIYPAWLVLLLLFWPVWAIGKVCEGILWVLFWPVRAIHKKNNPEEYAAFQEELKARAEAERGGR